MAIGLDYSIITFEKAVDGAGSKKIIDINGTSSGQSEARGTRAAFSMLA
jgi:hypothetical protein